MEDSHGQQHGKKRGADAYEKEGLNTAFTNELG
jgi:hypothetical protein